jgi:hypothetical protein
VRTHRENKNIHKNCGPQCSGYQFLPQGSPAVAVEQEEPVPLNPTIPPIPLRILMVLWSGFDKPTRADQAKTYEKSIPFEIDSKVKLSLQKNLPGFLEHSFYDSRKKILQVNCWVCVCLKSLKAVTDANSNRFFYFISL